MKTSILLFLALTVAACSNYNAPAAPTLSGNWAGTVQYTVNGTGGQQTLTLSLQQLAMSVTGTYSANSIGYFAGGNMTVRGTVGTTYGAFTGTLDFAPASNPNGCSGTFDVSGTGSGNTLTWHSAGFTSTCGSLTPTAVTISVTRQ